MDDCVCLSVYPLHYNLELKPNLNTLTFDGELKINVEVKAATNSVTLHSKELALQAASFADTALKLVEISYNLAETTVTLRFDQEIPAGKATLNISFTGILNGDMAGFYKSAYADADGKKQVMANTQFEALDARRAFPCWDEPAVKALFSVTLVVDAQLTALSNMPEQSVTHVAGGLKRVVFDVTPKMSTYLLAWAVGSFDYVQGTTKNGVLVRVFSPPGRASQGSFALEVGSRALDFYDDYFQVSLVPPPPSFCTCALL